MRGEVNTGDLIAETALIPCMLFSDNLVLFLAYQEIIISPVF